MPGVAKLVLKYLGVMIHNDLSNTPEILSRIKKTNAKFYEFGSVFLHSEVPAKTKRMLFINLVINTALSGLEAFTLTWAEVDGIDRVAVETDGGKAVGGRDRYPCKPDNITPLAKASAWPDKSGSPPPR